jgi:hypothetical protein
MAIEPAGTRWHRARARGALVGSGVVLATTAALLRAWGLGHPDRSEALAAVLEGRGLGVDRQGIAWLARPPLSAAAAARVPVVVRARPAPGEPHDVYLVYARLSPEGALLDVAGAYNLTETSAVDEGRPVAHGTSFAYVEQPTPEGERANVVRMVTLGDNGASAAWSRLERVQHALTELQDTGRLSGVARHGYTVDPAPASLAVGFDDGTLVIDAARRAARIDPARPLEVPDWLGVEGVQARRPGNLVTWAVDRVRAVVGDEAMQYVKAIGFSAIDVVARGKEAVTGDTGAEGIAEDLGQSELAAAPRRVPVDPEIGFPPPPLATWVAPALPGEGEWQPKEQDSFIRSQPGLPPTFYTTFLRTDRERHSTRVYVALWDPRVQTLHMMAGLAEPKSATGHTGPGQIPREPSVMRRVTAAMNAGFQSLHGEWGMMADGVVYLPPKPYGATVATLRDGTTAFGTWAVDAPIPDEMISYRQNMTAMVLDEKFNPYGRSWWGGTPSEWEDKTHTTRTSICLTKERFVAYFYGADLSPEALARAMILTRCSYGIGLDMNAGHSGLEYYKVAPEGELEPVGRHLHRDSEREGKVPGLDGWVFRARRFVRGMGLMSFPRYIQREGRDFFYLTLRHLLPPPRLVAPGRPTPVADDEGVWRIQGLAQHGFPYAVATTTLTLASGARAHALALDPRLLTTEAREASAPDALVLAAEPAAGKLGVWLSTDAFAIGPVAPVTPAVRVLSGDAPDPTASAVAAAGVQDDAGMLLYVELARGPASASAPVRAVELTALIGSLGCSEPIVLAERWPLALGGETDLAGAATRLGGSGGAVRLLRKPGPGGKRIFEATPIVPLREWHPLQAKRIRYFKKHKEGS